MASFSQIAKGTRARKPIPFPIANQRCESLADLPELAEQRQRDRARWETAAQAGQAPPIAPDDHVVVDLRVLSGAEESEVLQKARAYAVERGVDNPKDGDPIYELAKMAETLALGVIDHDSPEDATAPFFDGGSAQVLNEVDGDRIVFLYTRWEIWQGECSPRLGTLSGDQFYAQMVKVTVADDDLPFAEMRHSTAWVLTRTMGALLLGAPEAKSRFMSAFAGKPSEPTAKPKPPPTPKSNAKSKRR